MTHPPLPSQSTGGGSSNNDYNNQPNPHYYQQPAMNSPQMSAIASTNSDAFSDAGSDHAAASSGHGGPSDRIPNGMTMGMGYRLNPASATLSSPMLSSESYHDEISSGNSNTGNRRKLANMSMY